MSRGIPTRRGPGKGSMGSVAFIALAIFEGGADNGGTERIARRSGSSCRNPKTVNRVRSEMRRLRVTGLTRASSREVLFPDGRSSIYRSIRSGSGTRPRASPPPTMAKRNHHQLRYRHIRSWGHSPRRSARCSRCKRRTRIEACALSGSNHRSFCLTQPLPPLNLRVLRSLRVLRAMSPLPLTT
jgi:hypothetical protein